MRYVLVTPARNEAAFLEQTIKSVVAQTQRPLKWVIVSDGSTDGTDDIAARYCREHAWMELIRTPERKERHFAGKVHAFRAGQERLTGLAYEVIGNLDADITFDPDYFSFLMDKFAGDPQLGVAGTPFREGDFQYDYRFVSSEHVSGACQLFRRACFEAIGGYTPLAVGGIDLVAVTTARMRGWRTRSFAEKVCFHHKKTQAGAHSRLKSTFKSGYHDYLMGVSLTWQLSRSAYQMTKPPYIVGGSALLAGFLWAVAKRAKRPVSDEFVAFRQSELSRRLKSFLTGRTSKYS